MAATIALPDVATTATTARRAAEIRATWAADPDMPDVAGCLDDAVKVLAVRAAVHEVTGDANVAALPVPEAVEMSALLLGRQFPEVHDVMNRSGHRFIAGEPGTRWLPGDYLHEVYAVAFGPVGGRYWPV